MNLLSRKFTVLAESERYDSIPDERVGGLVNASCDVAARMDADENLTPTQVLNVFCEELDINFADMPKRETTTIIYDPNELINRFKGNIVNDIVSTYGGYDIKGNLDTFSIDKEFEFHVETKSLNGYNDESYDEANLLITEKREYLVDVAVDVNLDMKANVRALSEVIPNVELYHHGMLSEIKLDGVYGEAEAVNHYVQIIADGSDDYPLSVNITIEGNYNGDKMNTSFDSDICVGSSTGDFNCK
ncbi:MAG: hypothetical protein ACRC92_17325 [Peptostreptococcaceae bacterium]